MCTIDFTLITTKRLLTGIILIPMTIIWLTHCLSEDGWAMCIIKGHAIFINPITLVSISLWEGSIAKCLIIYFWANYIIASLCRIFTVNVTIFIYFIWIYTSWKNIWTIIGYIHFVIVTLCERRTYPIIIDCTTCKINAFLNIGEWITGYSRASFYIIPYALFFGKNAVIFTK